jgi:hypothetical protein
MHHMEGYAYVMFNWITRLLHWLASARLAIFTVAVVVVAVGLSFFVHTEPAIRLAGLCLQLLGIAAAALGIRDTRRMFGKPSFLQSLRSWATSWPRFRPKVQHASASGSVSIGSSASATVWHGVASDATLEQRIDALEANLKSVEGRLHSAEGAISTNERKFTSKLQQESQERGTQVAELHRKVEAASTDGLRLAAAGAFWLTIGVVLSTASPELLALSW